MSRGRGRRTLARLEAAIKILHEIQPTSVRGVCYQLLGLNLIERMSKSQTNSISHLLTEAREDGEIPWEWIVDESREAETAPTWISAEQLIKNCVAVYRRDYWQDQPYHVEVWSEKGTVRGLLGPVLNEYGVTFRVMHGFTSATVVNNIAELAADIHKPFIALYVGDWDPSGKYMSDVDLPRRVKKYGEDYGAHNVRLERIALLKNDLRGLPSFDPEIKRKDPRYRWFMKVVRTRCYELDAMRPPDLRARVEARIRSYIDEAKWDAARAVEQVEVHSMQEFHKSWQASISDGGTAS
jgi:hypothetical protein